MLTILDNSMTLTIYFLDKIHDHAELKHLLESIDAPLRRMNDDLKSISDNLQGRKLTTPAEQ